jgi:Tfp pilus assembly protein PilN
VNVSADRFTLFPYAFRGFHGPARHLSPRVAAALWATAAVAWFVAAQPVQSLSNWGYGSGGRLSGEQWALLFASLFGVLVLVCGLFAIAAYAVHWPAIHTRETRELIVQTRAELAELRVTLDQMVTKVESLRQLREQIAALEAQLMRIQDDEESTARQAGRVMSDSRELVDEIISELQSAATPAGMH